MWVELRAAAASGLFVEPNAALPKLPKLPIELALVREAAPISPRQCTSSHRYTARTLRTGAVD